MIASYIKSIRKQFEDQLKELVEIPTVSADQKHRNDILNESDIFSIRDAFDVPVSGETRRPLGEPQAPPITPIPAQRPAAIEAGHLFWRPLCFSAADQPGGKNARRRAAR